MHLYSEGVYLHVTRSDCVVQRVRASTYFLGPEIGKCEIFARC